MGLTAASNAANVNTAAAAITPLGVKGEANFAPVWGSIDEAVGTALLITLFGFAFALLAIALVVDEAFECFAIPFVILALATPFVDRDI